MRNAKLFTLSRRAAIVGGIGFALAANRPVRRRPHLLFVCLHGTVKSPIARELARRRANQRRIAIEARSRGIEPAEAASPELTAALVSNAIDVHADRLQQLSPSDEKWADIIVYFDPLPFSPKGKELQNWTDTPSANQHFDEALAVMRRRIDALIDELH